jgi:uncharacterized protein (DUF2267 family)
LREAGEYDKSAALLREVLETCRTKLGRSEAGTLNAQVSLAASLRSAGRAEEAAELLDDAFQRLRERFDDGAPETLACQLNRAANRLATNHVNEAVREMRATAEAYERRLGLGPRHPMTLVCKSNLSAALRASGKRQEAHQLAEEAALGCTEGVGAEHPYTLAAAMNLATCLYDEGDYGSASERMLGISQAMSKVLGPDHPDTLACLLNLRLISSALAGHKPELAGTAPLKRLVEALGPDHPTVTELRDGRLVYRLIDPHDPF